MKLTAIAIRSLSLPAGKTEAIVFDDDVPGFGLRIREGGSRAFVFQYKLGDKQRRMALGRVTALDIGKARETAKDLYARVRLGQDPAGDRAEAKVRATETFAAAAAQFLARQRARLRPKSYENVERHLLTHAKALHELQFAKVERRDIATCLAGVTTNNGAVTANRVRSTLSSLFAWAMGEGLVDRNPVTGTNQNTEMSRDRVLSPAELRIIWNALGDDHYGTIMRLLALSGQRASEIAGLRWSEVRETEIALLPERTKNKRAHVVPLSEPARAIIAAQPRRIGADGKPRAFVFGLGDGPFQGWSNCLDTLNARIAETTGETLPHWTPHDLRRSFATHAAEIGIQPHIIEAVLNHVSGHRAGVAGIYNRASYEREKRIALDRWAEWLTTVVEGRDTNVVTLRQA
jgi:integrase